MITGNIYIGLSVNIYKRWRDHKISKLSTRLNRSFKKYGFESHTFEIIHKCGFVELDKWEKHYVDLFKTFNTPHGLNLKDGGGSRCRSLQREKSDPKIQNKKYLRRLKEEKCLPNRLKKEQKQESLMAGTKEKEFAKND